MVSNIDWRASVEEARVEAREQDKALLIDLYDPESAGCLYMNEYTYANPRVHSLVEEISVPVRVDTSVDPGALRRYHSFWTPCILLRDPDGTEYRRSYGALDVDHFLSEFSIGDALRYLDHGRYEQAVLLLRKSMTYTSRTRALHPESLYWLGVAQYKLTGDVDALEEEWRSLRMQHPESTWTRKSDFLFQLRT